MRKTLDRLTMIILSLWLALMVGRYFYVHAIKGEPLDMQGHGTILR